MHSTDDIQGIQSGFWITLFALVGCGLAYGLMVRQFGGDFWSTPATLGDRLVPLSLLMQDGWQNFLFYYHAQSPVYEAMRYTLTLMEEPAGLLLFVSLHVVLGIFAVTSLYSLCLAMGCRWRIAAGFLVLFFVNPGFYLFSSQGLVDFPLFCLLAVAAWCLWQFLENPGLRTSFAFNLVLALITLIQPAFTPLFFLLPIFFAVLFYTQEKRLFSFAGFLLPFSLALLPYLRSFFLFGVFSIAGAHDTVNLKSHTLEKLSYENRVEGIQQGFFSEFVLCYPTDGSYKYNGRVYDKALCAEKAHAYAHGQVEQDYTSTERRHFNNIALISKALPNTSADAFFHNANSLEGRAMEQQVRADIRAAIWHYPRVYIEAVVHSMWQYFRSGNRYFFRDTSTARDVPGLFHVSWIKLFPYEMSIVLLISMCGLACYAASRVTATDRTLSPLTNTALTLSMLSVLTFMMHIVLPMNEIYSQKLLMLGCLIFTFIFVALLSVKAVMQRVRPDPVGVVMGFMLAAIVYYSVYIITVPDGGQERYRFALSGFFMVIFCTYVTEFHHSWLLRRRARSERQNSKDMMPYA